MQGTNPLDTVFYIAILLLSVIIHEVAHGLAARRLGDRTAEHAGRLTLNPVPHIDLWGSIIVPLLILISFNFNPPFLIGWAKPVPYNPYNFRNTPWINKWGEAFVAFAGPISNIIIFLIFGLFLRYFEQIISVAPSFQALIPAIPLIQTIVLLNIVLAVFNLVPLPPLDGSKILFSILPASLTYIRTFLERNALIIALFFILFLWKFVTPIIFVVYRLVVGV